MGPVVWIVPDEVWANLPDTAAAPWRQFSHTGPAQIAPASQMQCQEMLPELSQFIITLLNCNQ